VQRLPGMDLWTGRYSCDANISVPTSPVWFAIDAKRFVAIYEENLAGCPVGRIAGEIAGRYEGARRQAGAALQWARGSAGENGVVAL
jgi:hypothetical protein